jgi:hypothetical protein
MDNFPAEQIRLRETGDRGGAKAHAQRQQEQNTKSVPDPVHSRAASLPVLYRGFIPCFQQIDYTHSDSALSTKM